jgi:hypothetical protein
VKFGSEAYTSAIEVKQPDELVEYSISGEALEWKFVLSKSWQTLKSLLSRS